MTTIMMRIRRTSLLYRSKVEYADHCANHVVGCGHGCRYCYAMRMATHDGKSGIRSYEDWCQPRLVENALELLRDEIPRMRGQVESVQLCFSTDPFMYGYPEIAAMTMEIIRMLNEAGIKVVILTKGILPPELAETSRENLFGISLVSVDERFRRYWEPNTATYAERIEAQRYLHRRGCNTWLSMEPYVPPNIFDQEIHSILDAVPYVGRIVFGRWNHDALVNEYSVHVAFYQQQARIVQNYCRENGKECHIKNVIWYPRSGMAAYAGRSEMPADGYDIMQ